MQRKRVGAWLLQHLVPGLRMKVLVLGSSSGCCEPCNIAAACAGTMSDTMMQMLHQLPSRKLLAHLCPGSAMHDGMEIEL